jgi:hypothetical protein
MTSSLFLAARSDAPDPIRRRIPERLNRAQCAPNEIDRAQTVPISVNRATKRLCALIFVRGNAGSIPSVASLWALVP